jgi:hypothetical protein
MKPDFRVDALMAAARVAPRASAGHRGSASLELDDPTLLSVVAALVSAGKLVRRGHRVRLADYRPKLDPELRERVERLLDGLREAGAQPPRLDGIAARLGVTPPVLAQLRQSGELVQVAAGIDYPRDVWDALRTRVDRLARSGPLSVARLRDELRTSRRHAEAIIEFLRAERRRVRRGRQAG